jgi:hypothetical protein
MPAGAILMFAVLGTFISALVFGLCTYLLVLLGIVRRSHMAGSPFVECLAYGRWGFGGCWCEVLVCVRKWTVLDWRALPRLGGGNSS